MFEIESTSDSIVVRSDLIADHRSEVLVSFEKFVEERVPAGSSSVMVVFRELLMNAIEHGNKRFGRKHVFAMIQHLGGSDFKVVVEDEGDGFDYESVRRMDFPDDPRQMNSRGYVLIFSLASRVDFNEKGNRVEAYVGENGK